MARPQRIVIPPASQMPPPEFAAQPDHDEMTDDEIAQEKLGDIALLSGPEFQDWEWHIWRIRTKAEIATDPAGGMRELMDKRIGPIDVFDLREQLGGGTFELWGFFNNGDGAGKRLRKKPVFTFAGPRKRFDLPMSPAPAPAPTSGTDPALVALLNQINQRLGQLERTPAAAAAAPPASLKDVAETLVMLNSLQMKTAPAAINPDKEIVGTLLGMVEKGIEIGQAREPAAESNGTDWGKLFESALPVVDRLLARIPVRRAPPPSPRPAGIPVGAAAPSTATVVEPEREATEMNYRWPAAVESIANAIADGEDPREFTITLEHILNKQELAMLRGATIEMVMSELVGVAVNTYPILKTDQARSFIEAVLAELRSPSPEAAEQ